MKKICNYPCSVRSLFLYHAPNSNLSPSSKSTFQNQSKNQRSRKKKGTIMISTKKAASGDLIHARRCYLKELTGLRDQVRNLGNDEMEIIRNLVHDEQPVMYYEPMKYLNDDSLKNFIVEVVEEKLKV
jgi:hypothetical protein